MDDRNYDEIVSEQNEKLRIQRKYYKTPCRRPVHSSCRGVL